MESFIGQICLFAFNFVPKGWMRCEGQLISITQNSALFALIGTTYGGDGRTNFALPDLRNAIPCGVSPTLMIGGKEPLAGRSHGASATSPHNVLGMGYYICVYGIFPVRE